ncbi:MAG: hypothetical protein HYY44_00065 [Deltaproteobacteria bacterium]|nr:hypothetical protein [Deltaproteobacteria bacterium]MBI4373951.1 hypothetical protein [Deltaproteobacteria bacterium]
MSTILEIGPGRGDFLLHLAEERPTEKIAAIEYKRKRYEKLLQRASPFPNIELYLGDARVVLPEFPEESVEEVYILFSDPWPKRRHAKHRLFQLPFLENLCRVMKTSGRVVVATDDPSYRTQIEEVFRSAPGFSLLPDFFHFPTFYAQKWEKEGRSLFSLIYEKRNG